MKMNRTVVVRRDYLHYVKKYNRFEKRHKNMSVHLSPCFRDVQPGDVVTVGECRYANFIRCPTFITKFGKIDIRYVYSI